MAQPNTVKLTIKLSPPRDTTFYWIVVDDEGAVIWPETDCFMDGTSMLAAFRFAHRQLGKISSYETGHYYGYILYREDGEALTIVPVVSRLGLRRIRNTVYAAHLGMDLDVLMNMERDL